MSASDIFCYLSLTIGLRGFLGEKQREKRYSSEQMLPVPALMVKTLAPFSSFLYCFGMYFTPILKDFKAYLIYIYRYSVYVNLLLALLIVFIYSNMFCIFSTM